MISVFVPPNYWNETYKEMLMLLTPWREIKKLILTLDGICLSYGDCGVSSCLLRIRLKLNQYG